MTAENKIPDAVNASPSSNFTSISNEIAESSELSFKAIGLMTRLISRKKDYWNNYVTELVKNSKDGKASVCSGLKELEKAGYLVRIKYRDIATKKWKGSFWAYTHTKGSFDISSQIVLVAKKKCEIPETTLLTLNIATTRKPSSGFSSSGFSTSGKSATNNTNSNKTNINKTNNNKSSPFSNFLPKNITLTRKRIAQLESLEQKHGVQYLKDHAEYTKKRCKTNFWGYFIKGCKEGWGDAVDDEQSIDKPKHPKHLEDGAVVIYGGKEYTIEAGGFMITEKGTYAPGQIASAIESGIITVASGRESG